MKGLILIIAAGAVAGCVGSPEEMQDPFVCEGACDAYTSNGSTVSTFNNNLMILGGYNALFDLAPSSVCVEHLTDSPQVLVGNTTTTAELRYVSSQEEVAREIGVDLGLKIKYIGIGNAEAAIKIVSGFKSSSNAVNLLYRIDRRYSVSNRSKLQMGELGLSRLSQSPNDFVTTCGTGYVNGLQYGASFYMMITFTSSDEDTAHNIKASLGFDGPTAAPLSVDGNLESRLQSTADRSDVSVSVVWTAEGFDTDLNIDELVKGLTPETFANLRRVREDMDASIALDRCRDSGEPDCGGRQGEGYFNNSVRNATVTGVDIGFYNTLPNVDIAGDDPFSQIYKAVQRHEQFIRSWGELDVRIGDVYSQEIETFLNATRIQQASYNLAPPAEPVRDSSELIPIANRWMDDFYTYDGTQIGWVSQVVFDTISECWQQASLDIFTECSPPADGEEWQEIEDTLIEYATTGRVVPLHYRVGRAVSEDSAREECRSFNTEYASYRLPTRDDLPLLDPLVMGGAVDWEGADQENEIWFQYDEPSNPCADNMVNTHPSYINSPSEGQSRVECSSMFHKAVVICVPSSGPLPTLVDP